MYKLYHFPYSQHSRRVVSLLEEAAIPYELELVSMDKGAHMLSTYLSVNPNHQVPTLIDEDLKIHESNAILRYLCNKHELTDWYPKNDKLRAKVDQWLDWNQCRLSPAVIDIVFNKVFAGEQGDKQAIVRGETKLKELAAILEEHLDHSGYLVGDVATIADLSVASNLFQLGMAAAMPLTPAVSCWYESISSLKGFQASLPEQ